MLFSLETERRKKRERQGRIVYLPKLNMKWQMATHTTVAGAPGWWATP